MINTIRKILNKFIIIWNILAITIILFILVNALLWIVITARNSPDKSDVELVATSYSLDGKNDNKINLLLRESWEEQFTYEPFTQFKEASLNNIYDDISANGYRSIKDQGDWPINPENINIFVFGGSTTFGYGATGYQSIPSYLQEHLKNKNNNVSVYNFGRAYYYSTQERILFESLLNNGHIPDIVIFIDGLNDFFNSENIPAFTKTLNNYNNSLNQVIENQIGRLPIMKLIEFTSHKFEILTNASLEEETDENTVVTKVLNNYLTNKRIIRAVSEEFNIQPYFIWQPIPFYNSFRESDSIGGWLYNVRDGYKLMNNERLNNKLDEDFIWLYTIESNEEDYIDLVHYSPNFANRLADSISNYISPHINNILRKK